VVQATASSGCTKLDKVTQLLLLALVKAVFRVRAVQSVGVTGCLSILIMLHFLSNRGVLTTEYGIKEKGINAKAFIPFLLYGAPGEIRTPDQVVRSHLLYPAELRVPEAGDYTVQIPRWAKDFWAKPDQLTLAPRITT
jgi:hypothetical protein